MVKILVVEDDKDLNRYAVISLRNNGYEAVSAYDGIEALEKTEENKFDLILTDIMMPRMDGFDLAESIRLTDKTTPIIFMTAKDDKSSKMLGCSVGIDDYVTKPLDMDVLIMKINAIAPEYKKINLTDTVAEIVVGYEEIIENKGIELECEFDDITLITSSGYVEIILNNLLSNAIKFTDKNGKIKVSLKSASDGAIIKISDTGCGIDYETGKRIFEKFYQGDTSHAGEGNGLGLALVKRVIDIMGGEIRLKVS